MKRVLLLISLLATPLARGQESTAAASLPEIAENYKILKGKFDDLSDANADLQKRVAALESKVDALNAQLAKPTGDYASADDLKTLKAAIEEEDKKRLADNEDVMKELKLILKASKSGGTAALPTTHAAPAPTTADAPVEAKPDGPGFTYEVKPNDTPIKIAKRLFEEKGIKITSDQIMAANPSVKSAKSLWVGEKLFIPLPKGSTETANQ